MTAKSKEINTHYAALTKLQRVVEKNVKSKLFVPLAYHYYQLDQLEEAHQTLKHGLQWHPHSLMARALLSQVYVSMGNFYQATLEAQKVLDQEPQNLMALKACELAYLKLNDIQKAKAYQAKLHQFCAPFEFHHPLVQPLETFSPQSHIEDFKIASLAEIMLPLSKQKKLNLLKKILYKLQSSANA
ncbi:MAG: tetratricopeptide repeat protein [Deltaproteobacteria bacterium]|nr:tetratricopeptide repeat protein [Deltaproteobacteria bacterium]